MVLQSSSSHSESQAAGGATVQGSSFHAALRVLPRAQRDAMTAIYGYCRGLDDIADGGAPADRRLAAFAAWRAQVDALFAGTPAPPMARMGVVVERHALSREDLDAVIDGMEMDVAGRMCAPTWRELELYCDRVACAVGRMAVRVFGIEDEIGVRLAHHLGLALQLTNILRDLDEDAALGRLYVPREALAVAHVPELGIDDVLRHPAIDAACWCVARRARAEFVAADAVMDACPRASVRAPRLMAAAYTAILDRLEQGGWQRPRPRVRLRAQDMIGPLLRYGIV